MMVDAKRSGVSKVRKTKKVPSRVTEPKMPGDGEKKIARFAHIPEFRANVGARNPFIIALRKLELTHFEITPHFLMHTNLKQMMKAAFKNIPYEKMFDPKFGSPVYYGIYQATVRLAESCPKRYADVIPLLKKDPARKTAAPPPYCANMTKSAGQYGTINGNPTQYVNTNANRINGGVEFNDPVQGCIPDCWLISALSSVAWAEMNGLLPTKLSKVLPARVYPPSTWPVVKPITTTLSFYTDTAMTVPYYAHTNPTMITRYNANYYECWPSFYEKCFAGYYSKQRIPPFTGIADPPDYSNINYGSSFAATQDLTGNTMNGNTEKCTINYIVNGPGPDNDAQIIEDIRIGACNGAALGNGVFIATNKPATAYTYLTADVVPALANQARFGSNVVYDSPGLAANHAYSILGLYQVSATKKYVVLRNPWGFAGDTASFNAYSQGYLANLPALPNASYINNLGAEGIFGLQSLCFMRYFEQFGWTL
jgi:hypothetical protein